MVIVRIWVVFVFLIFSVSCFSAAMGMNQLQDLRIWSSPEDTKIVFDLSSVISYKIFLLKNPDRVVVDLNNTTVDQPFNRLLQAKGSIKKIRLGKHGKRVRVVFDMYEKVKAKYFILKPNARYGHRLILDLKTVSTLLQVLPKTSYEMLIGKKTQPFVIVIDPGHGGEDPGAIGVAGTKEKKVVLSIARKLYARLKRNPGIKPILTRTSDYYIGLQERIVFARKNKADLFISLHADAFKNHQAHGASVYTLSQHGATSIAAKWLANRENKADLMGGIKLKRVDKVLASVLLDLSQTSTNNKSRKLAKNILESLKRITKLHKKTIQRANFHVLKSPDIPAILIEVGFVSNKEEEKKLKSFVFQENIARSLAGKVTSFLAKEYNPVVIKRTVAR